VICHVPFDYLAHVVTVPVTVGDVEAQFIFDTGIGPNLVSEALAARVGCTPDGSVFTGRRMSGQPLTIPLASLRSLQLGTSRAENVPVGIFDMSAMAGLEGIDGFLSLSYFRTTPVTIDYPARLLILEDGTSLARRVADGLQAGVRVACDGCSTEVHVGMVLPGGRSISAEVDTGSDVLILNQALAGAAGIDLQAGGVRVVRGTDETGHEFVRYFTELSGDVSVTGAPAVRSSDAEVMIQEIIHDGLVGDRFLRNFVITFDLENSRMIFAAASEG
jgi:hypothetical protein